MTKTEKSGVSFFRMLGVCGRRRERLLPLLLGAVNWVWKGSHGTAWAVPGGSSRSCSYACGRGPAIGGRIQEGGVRHCKPVCGGLSHP